jgi:STE24 endopeptidase
MQSSTLTLAFAAALLLNLCIKYWLNTRQMRHVAERRHHVPAPFTEQVTLPAHQKAADYTLAKGRLALFSTAFAAASTLGWTLLGGMELLNTTVRDATLAPLGPLGYQLVLLGAFMAVGTLLELPFDWYSTFHLEQRFGFNRMTPGMFWKDQLKGLGVAVVIGLPMASLVLWIMQAAGDMWWLWAWAAWVAFNLLLMVIYPTVIAPMFNTFKPLDDETLAQRVQALMSRCGFAAKGLYVMDGSRRSAHANAYFTGLGAAKRVVFYDTLLSRLAPGEVEAVLAHELGHFKRKHVAKRMGSIFGLSLVSLALLGWLSAQAAFYTGLGVTPNLNSPNAGLALLLFALALPPFIYFISPLMAQVSRRHEFEADAFACTHAKADDLASALLKLHEDNAGTLTPDPLYVRFYYSHPPASERLAALRRLP